MSVEHLAIVLHHSRAKGTAKLILLGVANHQGDGGSWPAVTTLSRYANVSERNVRKALDALVSKGELLVTARPGRTNVYHVNVACPSWCDRTPNHRDTRPSAGRQRGLWITTPVDSDRGDGSDSPPLSDATVPPLSDATAEPSGEPTPNPPSSSPPQPQDTRTGWCVECGLAPRQHDRAQATGAYHSHPWTSRA